MNTPNIYIKTVNPTVNDDVNTGVIVGDFWINETTETSFQLMKWDIGAAVWKQITA